jgi:hypothetical protein
MRRFERILAGRQDAVAAPGSICALALQVREQAIGCGLRVICLTASRIRCSQTKILSLSDGSGNRWIIRVSNHFMPRRTGHEQPHLDLVSFDGVSGIDRATAYLARIARGEVEWVKPQLTPRRKGVR